MAPRPLKPSPRPKATDGTSALKTLAAPQPAQSSSSNGASVASQAQDSSYMASESDGWHLGLENPRRASAGPVFVQQWRLRGQSRPGPSNGASVASQAQDSSSMASESDGWHQNPRRASAGPVFVQQWRLRGQPSPGQQFYGFRKRPRRASSLRPAMAPPWPITPRTQQWRLRPAKPRTAVLWLPKATDGTSAFTRFAAKATDGTSALKTLAAPQPAQSSSSNGASVASQAQDSSYTASESDGWHLGLENPRRARSDGWHLGLEIPRCASRLRDQSRPGPSNGASVASQAQDSSSMASESDGWHLGLDTLRRASAGPVFVQQWRWRPRRQPGPGQQFYGFRKRRMTPRPLKPSPCPKATDGTSALKTLAQCRLRGQPRP